MHSLSQSETSSLTLPPVCCYIGLYCIFPASRSANEQCLNQILTRNCHWNSDKSPPPWWTVAIARQAKRTDRLHIARTHEWMIGRCMYNLYMMNIGRDIYTSNMEIKIQNDWILIMVIIIFIFGLRFNCFFSPPPSPPGCK